jgi:ribose transport system substrate-binding protein
MYSTETQGAAQALAQSPLAGKVRIYDKGATPWAVDALREGQIEATSPERAVTSTATMLQALVDARAGKPVPAYFGRDGAPAESGGPASGFEVFTRDTLGDYQGQGG